MTGVQTQEQISVNISLAIKSFSKYIKSAKESIGMNYTSLQINATPTNQCHTNNNLQELALMNHTNQQSTNACSNEPHQSTIYKNLL